MFLRHIADAVWVPKIGCEQFERNDFSRQNRRRRRHLLMPFSSNSLARQAMLYNSAMIERLMAGRIIKSRGAKIARTDPAQAARSPRRPSKSRFVTAILPKLRSEEHTSELQ